VAAVDRLHVCSGPARPLPLLRWTMIAAVVGDGDSRHCRGQLAEARFEKSTEACTGPPTSNVRPTDVRKSDHRRNEVGHPQTAISASWPYCDWTLLAALAGEPASLRSKAQRLLASSVLGRGIETSVSLPSFGDEPGE